MRRTADPFYVVPLDVDGALMSNGNRVPPADVATHLHHLAELTAGATDIVVFVHGWQNSKRQAMSSARRLFSDISAVDAARYRGLDGFSPFGILVTWPSRSSPLPDGYRRIRDRAHLMTETGHAAHVIGALLGTIDAVRQRPERDLLRTAGGQYLHCVGHSFGCRMLGEAIMFAADPPSTLLDWPWPTEHPFAVDTFLALQMATPPSIFTDRFAPLTDGSAPIVGPVVVTVSKHDRALSRWHRIPEGVPGIGAVGVPGRPTITLHRCDDEYTVNDFDKVTNVDTTWCFRRGRFRMQHAHSDIWHAETTHLVLSLASLSR